MTQRSIVRIALRAALAERCVFSRNSVELFVDWLIRSSLKGVLTGGGCLRQVVPDARYNAPPATRHPGTKPPHIR